VKGKIVFILLHFVLIVGLSAQDLNESGETDHSKWIISAGIGYDHELLGIKLTYRFNDHLGIHSAFGINQLRGGIPALGLEYRFKVANERMVPFVFVSYGKNRVERLFKFGSTGIDYSIMRSYLSLNFGGGLAYKSKVKPKISLFLGVNFRISDGDAIRELYQEYNRATNSSLLYKHNLDFRFIAGVARSF